VNPQLLGPERDRRWRLRSSWGTLASHDLLSVRAVSAQVTPARVHSLLALLFLSSISLIGLDHRIRGGLPRRRLGWQGLPFRDRRHRLMGAGAAGSAAGGGGGTLKGSGVTGGLMCGGAAGVWASATPTPAIPQIAASPSHATVVRATWIR
jgi:hypothetical protein